jgi:hypothetical protein
VISISRVEVANKNAEKDAFCLNILLGQFDPWKMRTLWCLEMWGTKYPLTQYHTPERWIPHNEELRKTTITMPCCTTRLLRLFSCLQSEFLSFRRYASSHFNFLSPDRFPVLDSTVLRVQLVTKFLRIFGSDPYMTSVIQSDCWWLIANKNCRLVINTATVRNAVYRVILCTHVIIRT